MSNMPILDSLLKMRMVMNRASARLPEDIVVKVAPAVGFALMREIGPIKMLEPAGTTAQPKLIDGKWMYEVFIDGNVRVRWPA